MGLDTSATLFYGITDGEEDPDCLDDDFFSKYGLDPPAGIDLAIAGSYAYPVPFLASSSSCTKHPRAL